MDNIKLERAPVLIGGMRRSGTTLLRKVIGSHQEIACLPTEFRLLEKFYNGAELKPGQFDAMLRQVLQFLSDKNLQLSEAGLRSRLEGCEKSWRNLFVAVLEEYRAGTGKSICGDKSPLYEFYLPQLREWFSDTGFFFVHLVRDPLDCYASYNNLLKDRNGAGNNSINWALAWNRSAAIALENAAKYPETYLYIRYEDFISSPELFIEKFCKMLNLEPQAERMLAMSDYNWQLTDSSAFLDRIAETPAEYRGKIRTSDAVKRTASVNEEDRVIIEQYCGPMAAVLGYEQYTNNLYASDRAGFHRALAPKILDELPYTDFIKDIQIRYSASRFLKSIRSRFSKDGS